MKVAMKAEAGRARRRPSGLPAKVEPRGALDVAAGILPIRPRCRGVGLPADPLEVTVKVP
jgi:hypothetical protein